MSHRRVIAKLHLITLACVETSIIISHTHTVHFHSHFPSSLCSIRKSLWSFQVYAIDLHFLFTFPEKSARIDRDFIFFLLKISSRKRKRRRKHLEAIKMNFFGNISNKPCGERRKAITFTHFSLARCLNDHLDYNSADVVAIF